MSQEDQAAQDAKRARQKQKAKKVARVMNLLTTCFYTGLIVLAARTGYLSRIGVLVGLAYVTPGIIATMAGFTGKPRLEGFFNWLNFGMPILLGLAIGLAIVWPRDNSLDWRPYRLERELAALEAQRAIPDEQNAALRYEAALKRIDADDRPECAFSGSDLHDELGRRPWKGDEHPDVSAWLDSQATVLTELLEIGPMEQCRWPAYVINDALFPVPRRKLRHGTYLLTLAGNRHLGEGHIDAALETYFAIFRQADHLRQQTSWLDFTYAFDIEEVALGMVRYTLVHSDLAPEQIDAMARRLPSTTNDWQSDAKRMMDFEEFRFVNFLAGAYEINTQGQVRFAASFPVVPRDATNDSNPVETKKIWRLYYHMNMPRDPQKLWPMARAEFHDVRHFLDAGPLLAEDADEWGPSGMFSQSFARIACNALRFGARYILFDRSSYVRWGQSYAKNLTLCRGTWLTLGLRRYKDQHGTWPESLDQIAEYALPEAFGYPMSGNHYVYRRDDDGFQLHSPGVNGTDEDGRWDYCHAEDGYDDDLIIWPIPLRTPEPPSEEVTEEVLKQIYGDDPARMLEQKAEQQE